MNYLDVLYTPLDTPIRPEIDHNLFNDWAASVYPQSCVSVESKQKYVAHDRLQNEYPWNLAYGMHAGKWQDGFESMFPDLARFCYEGFGLLQEHLYTVLFLPTRKDFIGKYFWHADPDVSGLRFYLRNDDPHNNHLLMRETKTYVEDLWAIQVEPELAEEILLCRIKSPDQSFFLNNVYAAHTPVNSHDTNRIAVFVTIKRAFLNEVVRNIVSPLVIQSANKYTDYSIFRKQTHDS